MHYLEVATSCYRTKRHQGDDNDDYRKIPQEKLQITQFGGKCFYLGELWESSCSLLSLCSYVPESLSQPYYARSKQTKKTNITVVKTDLHTLLDFSIVISIDNGSTTTTAGTTKLFVIRHIARIISFGAADIFGRVAGVGVMTHFQFRVSSGSFNPKFVIFAL